MAAGGISTLVGVRYELQAVMFHVPDLLRCAVEELRYQLPALTMETHDVAPARAFLNDFSIRDRAGKRFFYQVKHRTTDSGWTINALAREGVVLQMFRQHKTSPEATLGFISNIQAPALSQLIQAAKEHANSREFLTNLPKRQKISFSQLRNALASRRATDAQIYSMLSRAEVQLRTEEGISVMLRHFATDRYGDPGKFANVVKEYLEKNPGRPVHGDLLQAELDAVGLFRLPLESGQDVREVFQLVSADLRSHVARIAGIHIPRAETGALLSWIDSLGAGKGVAALLDVAGSGKSVIMHDVLTTLEARGVAVLAIKADRLTPIGHSSGTSAKEILRLANEPESFLAAAARRYGRAVLIVDQIDALSMTFARDQRTLDLMLSLISRAATIDGVAVIFSCRSFDRHYDPKLRHLSAAHEVPIKPLTKEQIEPVLQKIGVNWKQLTERERVLLQQPQHLDLFARVAEENSKRGSVRREVASVQDLYDLLWDLVVIRPRRETAPTSEVIDAIGDMTDAIESSQTLAQPAALLDQYHGARDYLLSAGILRRDGPVLSFFHQSFFDYVFSRRFTARERSLFDYIRQSDQGLFQRPIVNQVLTYLRSSNHKECVAQVKSLCNGAGKQVVRYHLRHLTFGWFGQQAQLSEHEKALGIKFLRTHSARAEFLRGSRGNAEWFDTIKEDLMSLLDAQEETVHQVLYFLHSVQDVRGADVYRMLLPRLGSSKEWNHRIQWCIARQTDWGTEEAEKCLTWFFQNDPQPWEHFDFVLSSVAKANVGLSCKILRILLSRFHARWIESTRSAKQRAKIAAPDPGEDLVAAAVRGGAARSIQSEELLPRQLHGMVEVTKVCGAESPGEYLKSVIPWIDLVAKSAKTWRAAGQLVEFSPFTTGFDADVDEPDPHPAKALLQSVRRALVDLGHSDAGQFLAWAKTIEHSRVAVLHQLLSEALAAVPARHASWAHEYLRGDVARLELGWYGDRSGYSGTLIGAIFPHLARSQRASLENTILNYRPSWERDEDGDDKFAGITQLRLLWDVPSPLLGARARNALRRLKRKFSDYRPRERPSFRMKKVTSPVPEERAGLMSLEEWLAQMRHFDEKTGWDRELGPRLSGGIVELSRQLHEEASKDPTKFVPMAEMLDDQVASGYWAALLTGLSKSKLPSAELHIIASSLNRRRPNDNAIERAFCEMVKDRETDPIPEESLRLVRHIALNSSDPAPGDMEREPTGQQRLDDPFQHGINHVRGWAVRLYIRIAISAGDRERDRLLEDIRTFARDESSGVRACLIDGLPVLLRAHPKEVQKAFRAAMEDRSELLDSQPTHEFIYWSTRGHFNRVLPFVKSMVRGRAAETRIAAGRLITLAWFDRSSIKRLYEECIKGDPALRQGLAGVLSRNVDDSKLRSICLRELRRLLSDRDDQVARSISHVFGHLPPPDAEIKRFIRAYISSDVVDVSPDRVAEYATRIELSDGSFALEIGERLFKRYGELVANHWQRTGLLDDDLVNISMAVYRTGDRPNLKRRAMDLFEEALRVGSTFAKQALERADR